MVPSGWVKAKFGDHIDLLSGFAFKSAQYSEDENDIKLLRGDNIEPNKLRWANVKRWPKKDYSSLERYHLKEGDFIIAMDRTWITAGLKVAEVKKEDLPCLLVQRVSRIRTLPSLNQELLKFYFSSYDFEYYVKSVQTETAVPHISSKQIRDFSFLLPPLPEQQKIAKILITWDKAINTTERLIENSKQQKKALMQQLLTGQKRLLDDSGQRFSGDWENTILDKLASLTAGGTPSTLKNQYWNGDIPWMNSGEVNLKQVFNVEGRITQLGLDNSSTKIIPVNSVLIALAGQGKTRGTVAINRIELCTNQSIAAIIPDEQKLHHDYLYYNLDSRYEELRMMSTGAGGRGGLNLSILKSVKISLPSIKEQQKIAAVLTNADREIEVLEQQLADLQQEKKALMQQLLTGKKRVKVA